MGAMYGMHDLEQEIGTLLASSKPHSTRICRSHLSEGQEDSENRMHENLMMSTMLHRASVVLNRIYNSKLNTDTRQILEDLQQCAIH